VVIAFTCGVIAQYLSRVFFSFNYEKRIRRYGAIWGGLGIMAITYFMLIKGAKGASFMGTDIVGLLTKNTVPILIGSFIGWTVMLYILNRLFKVDILKVLVLVGTFALAMAFAGNDLVNFIGVPLAGFNSYMLYTESGIGADQFLMDGLAGKVPTPTLLLLLAGIVMVVTLYTSKKAKSVVKTSLDLGRQDEGFERFSSFSLSRSLVRSFASMANNVNNILPSGLKNSISKQFDQSPFDKRIAGQGKEAPAFDMIRASVTLVVSSILIAIGTNLKLPLSTTYVTFMVFMGTSLADGAWGRESAVYRVSGVLSVIGGWFFTAFSAFLVAFIIAMIFHFGGLAAIGVVLIFAGFVMYRTHRYHNEQLAEKAEIEKTIDEGILSKDKIIHLCTKQIKTFLMQFKAQVDLSFKGLRNEDLDILNQSFQSFKSVQKGISKLKSLSSNALDRVPEHELEAGHMFILVVDYLYEMSKHAMDIIQANLNHVDNNHKPLHTEQIEELLSMHDMLTERYEWIIDVYKSGNLEAAQKLYEHVDVFVTLTRNVRKKQIKRIKNREVGTRNSALYLAHLGELRNLGLFSNRIVRVYDDLILRPSDEGDLMGTTLIHDFKQIRKDIKTLPKEKEEIEDLDNPSREPSKK
jgi:hypothetical protein